MDIPSLFVMLSLMVMVVKPTINGSAGGNVGVYPGTVFTERASITISGDVHLADTAAIKAKDDLVSAFDDAAGRKPVTRIPSELGVENDPNGVFVFKCATKGSC